MRRVLAASVIAVALLSGCCVAERAVDVSIETAGKLTSKGIDAVASSDDDTSKPPKRR